MEISLLVTRLALSAVFGVAGIAKLLDPAGSEKALKEFGVPEAFLRPLAVLLPAAELLIAGSLLFLSSSWFGSIAGAAMLLAFTIGMLYQLAQGRAPDCHCFGQIHSEPVGTTAVIRNVMLMGLAVFLALQGRTGQGVGLINSGDDVAGFVFGISVVVLLVIAIILLKGIANRQIEIIKSIEVLEVVSRDGTAVEREHIADPHQGMPIGALFPDFELPDVEGRLVSLADLSGQSVLFLFISPTCTPCKALIPEFDQWQDELAGKVRLVFISNGRPQDNIDKFGGESKMQILLQTERELADQVNAQWTPTAVFVDKHGRIASHVAAGDTAIRGLVDQIRDTDLDESYTYFTGGGSNGHVSRIGSEVPSFSLKDINGNEIRSDDLKGVQTLVTFWSLTCPHCQHMMADLSEWERARSETDPKLIVFSDGDIDEHKKIGLQSPIVIDAGYKVAEKFGMFGTPSAVLVNSDGRIISETATGAPGIWSLVGGRSSKSV